jgi:extracellular elastinolytic metalloproteinase
VREHGRGRRVAWATRAVPLVLVAAAILAVGAPAQSAVNLTDADTALPDFDVRTDSVPPTAAQVAAAQALGADVSWNKFGTPSSVYNLDGNLATGVSAADAVAAARAWVAQNATLFGLSSTSSLTLVRDTPLAGGVGHAVLLGQTFGNVLAAPDGLVTVAVAGSGGSWNVTYASSTLARSDGLSGSYSLSPIDAWVQSARAVGKDVSPADVTVAGTQNGWTELTVTGFDQTQAVRASAFPVPGSAALSSYETVVANGTDVGYAQTVDASSGAVLARENTVDNLADNPTWQAFPAAPPTTPLNRFPWNYPSVDNRQLWCWTPTANCDLAVGNPANSGGVSMPWDQILPAGPSTFTTSGNNAFDHEQWNASRGAPVGFMPTSPTRDYTFPWTNVWFTSQCNPANLTTPGVGNDISAATANLFAMHNRMHDWSYYLGFTEAAWNGQVNNFTTPAPFLGNDPVNGNAQSGAVSGGFPTFAGRDNANMGTNPDGRQSVTNMFLWQPIAGSFYAPCVDGDYDMGVIGHEYSHMIENRMIGKGNRRQGNAAGAMGEAFGDLDAIEYLNENHDVPVFGIDPFVEGAYVTGNTVRGIRNYTMDWPMSGPFPSPGKIPQVDSLNFGDFGYDITGPEVHADGELWVATNYTLRQLMLDRYPARGRPLDVSCAAGKTPVDQCPGDRRWIQLYFDAMLLMPTAPTMIDARNAILAADQTRFGGANQDILWRGFAERGFGQFASQLGNPSATPPVTPANDTDPIPDFSSPDENNATVTFNAVAKDGGAPVNAKIFVGDYEARVTPIADTNPTNDPGGTAPTNLDATAQFVATGDHRGDGHNDHGFRNDHGRGRDDDNHGNRGDDNGAGYNFVASAPGYGHVRFRIDDLRPGENRTVTIEFATNLASSTQGATATGDGTNQASLIDDTEGTDWSATGAPVQGREVTIKLAGTAPVAIGSVNVSAMLVPGQNRFTALRQFELDSCTAGASSANPNCDGAIADGWRQVMVSEPDAFPSVNPRPVAPDLQLRTWDVRGRTRATHIRLVVLNNQCTGQSSYQGEQDNDPTFSTDCRTTSLTPAGQVALPERDTEVHANEVEVFSSASTVHGADTGDRR